MTDPAGKAPQRRSDGPDRAQSNVIGAILLIVVTIILVSFVAVYVFDVGGQLQGDTPQASFTFDSDDGTVTATHDGGESLPAQNVDVVVTYTNGTTLRSNGSTVFGVETIRTGDSAQVASDISDGDEVRIVYIDPDSDQGTTLARYEA